MSALLKESKDWKDVVGAIVHIPLEYIQENPFQPRTSFKQERLDELAASIETLGLVQPITVRRIEENCYQLISGERRLRASKIAKLKNIPCYIRVAKDEEALEMALVENIHREDLDPIEVALSYQRLQEEFSLTQEELSKRLGKRRSTISNFIRLLRLSPIVQAGLRDKFISVGHAKLIMSLTDHKEQVKLYEKVMLEDLTVRKTEDFLKVREKVRNNIPKKKKSHSKHILEIEESLFSILKVKARVKSNEKGQGVIQISFQNKKELDQIVRIIKS